LNRVRIIPRLHPGLAPEATVSTGLFPGARGAQGGRRPMQH